MRRERKVEKTFENVHLKKTIWPFKKHVSWVLIDPKNSLDRSKQTEALSIKFKNFRSIEKQNGSIEMGRGSPILRKTQIFEKISNQLKALKFKNKMHEYEMIWFSKQEF